MRYLMLSIPFHFRNSTRRRLAPPAVTIALLAATTAPVHADVAHMPWATVGTLAVSAKFGSRTTTLKETAVGPWAFTFDRNGSVSITGEGVSLDGTWTQTGSKFAIQLGQSSTRTVLDGIQKDLSAQSNLRINLEPLSAAITGKENLRTMAISGAMVIKASVRYPDYSERLGRLTLTYRFTGGMPPM